MDILVSNAAVNPGAGPLAETSPDVIDKILDINVKVCVVDGGGVAKMVRVVNTSPN